jgi:iron-sulfur cluster repair protein YtfE (RIC family)
MSSDQLPPPFATLDDYHRQMQVQLAELAALAQRLDTVGADATAEQQAKGIEAFFSETSRQHHIDEERTVFPLLLASADAELVAAVRSLRQDHGWIEENWIELAPQLRAIADGNHWVDAAEFQHAAQVFYDLCVGHIELEESLIYPESKSHWAEAVAERTPAAPA